MKRLVSVVEINNKKRQKKTDLSRSSSQPNTKISISYTEISNLTREDENSGVADSNVNELTIECYFRCARKNEKDNRLSKINELLNGNYPNIDKLIINNALTVINNYLKTADIKLILGQISGNEKLKELVLRKWQIGNDEVNSPWDELKSTSLTTLNFQNSTITSESLEQLIDNISGSQLEFVTNLSKEQIIVADNNPETANNLILRLNESLENNKHRKMGDIITSVLESGIVNAPAPTITAPNISSQTVVTYYPATPMLTPISAQLPLFPFIFPTSPFNFSCPLPTPSPQGLLSPTSFFPLSPFYALTPNIGGYYPYSDQGMGAILATMPPQIPASANTSIPQYTAVLTPGTSHTDRLLQTRLNPQTPNIGFFRQ